MGCKGAEQSICKSISKNSIHHHLALFLDCFFREQISGHDDAFMYVQYNANAVKYLYSTIQSSYGTY